METSEPKLPYTTPEIQVIELDGHQPSLLATSPTGKPDAPYWDGEGD